MARLRSEIARAGARDCPVLIVGETGSGKELTARAVHEASARRAAPFLAVNGATIPGSLFESEAFGHARGAFTGAHRAKKGLFELVKDGLLFIDEVAELPADHQAKLLRVLDERRFRPLGAMEDVPFRGRLLTATHADLAERAQRGLFRDDLRYRIEVLRIHVPALRDRLEDIRELTESFATAAGLVPILGDDVLSVLRNYDWPGNVRQLQNVIERLAARADGAVGPADALAAIEGGVRTPRLAAVPGGATVDLEVDSVTAAARGVLDLDGSRKLDAVARRMVQLALREAAGNQTAAAQRCGLSRDAFRRLARRAGIPFREH